MSSAPGLDLRFGEHKWNVKVRRVDCLNIPFLSRYAKRCHSFWRLFIACEMEATWKVHARLRPLASEAMADVGLIGRPLTNKKNNLLEQDRSLTQPARDCGRIRKKQWWRSVVAAQ